MWWYRKKKLHKHCWSVNIFNLVTSDHIGADTTAWSCKYFVYIPLSHKFGQMLESSVWKSGIYSCYWCAFLWWWICNVPSIRTDSSSWIMHRTNGVTRCQNHPHWQESQFRGHSQNTSRHIRVRPATCIYFWHAVVFWVPGYKTNGKIWSADRKTITHKKAKIHHLRVLLRR